VGDTTLTGKSLSFIELGPNGQLWLGISNADKPSLALLDTSSDMVNDALIGLTMPPVKLQFLEYSDLGN